MEKVTVRVPASTANLGPGFDSFGCALGLYNELTFAFQEKGLTITGCDPQYANSRNLAYVAYCEAIKEMGLPVEGLHIHITGDVPVSRGLGSSAALLAAGALGASALHGNRLERAELLTVTTRIEGHPDNLAPAIYGGLTASLMEDGVPVAMDFPLSPDWQFVALVPDFELSTKMARAALPKSVPHRDAVYNVSHAALLLKALELGDENLLQKAMGDRLHQPYRKSLIQGYDRMEEIARACGAAGFCISGAGPTLLCLTKEGQTADRIRSSLGELAQHWRVLPLMVDIRGACVIWGTISEGEERSLERNGKTGGCPGADPAKEP